MEYYKNQSLTPEEKQKLQPILDAVSKVFSMPAEDIRCKSNMRIHVDARRMAFLLTRRTQPDLILPKVGAFYGGKHYSTVIHSLRGAYDLLYYNKPFKELYKKAEALLNVGL